MDGDVKPPVSPVVVPPVPQNGESVDGRDLDELLRYINETHADGKNTDEKTSAKAAKRARQKQRKVIFSQFDRC